MEVVFSVTKSYQILLLWKNPLITVLGDILTQTPVLWGHTASHSSHKTSWREEQTWQFASSDFMGDLRVEYKKAQRRKDLTLLCTGNPTIWYKFGVLCVVCEVFFSLG